MASTNLLFSGIPVSDRAAALDWYATFFGRPADEVVDDEALWGISDAAWVFVVEDARRAGGAILTLDTDDMDGVLARLADRGIAHEPVETYGNGVRHVTVIDPDGNSISLAQAPAENPDADGSAAAS